MTERSTSVRRAARHPSANEEWFQALPHEHRARINREWRQGLARDQELEVGARRRLARSACRMALLYLVFDVCCAGRSAWSALVAGVLGAVIGVVLEHCRVARLLSGTVGLGCFFCFQWLSRGGLAATHFFWLFPVGAISAYLGVEREE